MTTKQAIILAAGRGIRLRTLSDHIPKCLLPMERETILSRQLDGLAEVGIEHVVIVTGYKRHLIEQYVGATWKGMNVTCLYNDRWSCTNNITSLALTCNHIYNDFILLEGDVVWTDAVSLAGMGDNESIVSPFNSDIWGTHVSLDEQNNIATFILGKGLDPSIKYPDLYKTVNIYSFKKDYFLDGVRPALIAALSLGQVHEYYESVFQSLTDAGQMILRAKIWPLHQWYEIDTPQDYLKASIVCSRPVVPV